MRIASINLRVFPQIINIFQVLLEKIMKKVGKIAKENPITLQ